MTKRRRKPARMTRDRNLYVRLSPAVHAAFEAIAAGRMPTKRQRARLSPCSDCPPASECARLSLRISPAERAVVRRLAKNWECTQAMAVALACCNWGYTVAVAGFDRLEPRPNIHQLVRRCIALMNRDQ